MPSDALDLSHLTLLIQRLLDAEVLLEADGATLLDHAEAARLALGQGRLEEGRGHIEQIARWMEALIQSRVLEASDGRAVLETARRLLSIEA